MSCGSKNLSGPCFSFGDFELDIDAFQLRRRSEPLKLERIPLELLILLVQREGQLVAREEIAARLWDNCHVDVTAGINTAIRKLRLALQTSPGAPAFVETVPGKGYRFRSSGDRVTIAVLPFQNLSADPEQEYLSDGLTEEAIASLGRLAPSRISVISRTSSMVYKQSNKTAAEIGRELGAAYLVESTVRRDPQQIRITCKLIRASDQLQVWSNSYDRYTCDAIDIQQEIGAAIARQIGAELSRPATANRSSAQDPDAQDLYLRGRYYWHQRTPEAMRKSVEYFQAALRQDPAYALAHAGLAQTYIIQTLVSGANPAEQRYQATAAIERALELEPGLPEALTAAGMARFFMLWDWEAAERAFEAAVEADPSNATAHQFYGHLLSNSLRHDEALNVIRRARELDPLSPIMYAFEAMFLCMAGRPLDAEPIAQHALTLDRDCFPAHTAMGTVLQAAGNMDGALQAYREAHRLSRGNVLLLAYQGALLGQTGRLDEARQILATIKQISQNRFVSPYAVAIVYAGIRDGESALQWLERAFEARDMFLVFLLVDPRWDPIRDHPRFQTIVKNCGFAGGRLHLGNESSGGSAYL